MKLSAVVIITQTLAFSSTCQQEEKNKNSLKNKFREHGSCDAVAWAVQRFLAPCEGSCGEK